MGVMCSVDSKRKHALKWIFVQVSVTEVLDLVGGFENCEEDEKGRINITWWTIGFKGKMEETAK